MAAATGRLAGRTAIITGAAQGIGAVYARALAAEGAAVSLSDLGEPEAMVAEIRAAGGQAIGSVCDVTDAAAVAAMVAKTNAAFGDITVLVNNAAIFATLALKSFEQIGSDEWDRLMAVNVRGTFECIKAVIPQMRAAKYGKIINIASGTVFKGAPMMLHYVASKGAVVALTRSVAREGGDDGVRCNCLAPGLTMSAQVLASTEWAGDVARANVATRCIKREERPEDLTGALVFLSSAESDFMTGQTIVVDGGSVMH